MKMSEDVTTKTVSKLKLYAIKDEFIRRGLLFGSTFTNSKKVCYQDFGKVPGKLCYVSDFHNPNLYPNVVTLKAKLQNYLLELGIDSEKLVFVDWRLRKVPSDAVAHFLEPQDVQEILLAVATGSDVLLHPFKLTPLTKIQEIAYYQEGEVRKEIMNDGQMLVSYQSNMLEGLMKVLNKEETYKRSIEQGAKVGSICNICHDIFPSRSSLFRHIRVHQQNSSTIISNNSSSSGSSHDGNVNKKCEAPLDEPEIVHDDDYIRIVSKPQGLSTQGERGCVTLHASNVLLIKGPQDTKFYRQNYRKAVPCHRLDKLTGFLLYFFCSCCCCCCCF